MVTKDAHRDGFLFAFSAPLLASNPPGINDLDQAFSFINGPATSGVMQKMVWLGPIFRILNDDLRLFSLRCTFLIDYPVYQPARPSLEFP